MMMVDISINITLHSEGLLFYKTFRSISAQLDYIDSIGKKPISYEINISIDNPSEETSLVIEYILKNYNYKIKLYKLNTGDISYNRNFLIDKSSGKYIAFFDGDDIFSNNYLYECFRTAESRLDIAIFTAENFITFEGQNILWKKPDSSSPYYTPAMMLQENPFPSQVFAPTRIFKHIKYRELGPRGGVYGSEDWHWMTMAANAGYKMVSVKNTIYAYRVKLRGSLLKEHQLNYTTILPSNFFKPKNFIKNCENTIDRIRPMHRNQSNDNDLDLIINQGNKLRKAYDTRVPLTIRRFIASLICANKLFFRDLNSIIVNKIRIGKVNNRKGSDDIYEDLHIEPKDEFIEKFSHLFDTQKEINVFWDQWKALNKFEPLINQDLNTIRTMAEYDIFKKGDFSVAYEYYKFCKYVVDNNIEFKHIIFVPWLISGGSDNVAIKVSNELSKKGQVLLVATDKFTITNRYNKLSSGVKYYNFENLFKASSSCRSYVDNFFIKLIQNFNIETVSSINSMYANNLIERYGRQIKDSSKIFVYRWSIPKNYYDNYYEWPANFYQNAHNNLDYIITDNNVLKKDINRMMNPLENRIKVLDMPIHKHPKFKNSFAKFKKRILIAGRIAKWDKLIDVALLIAKSPELKDIEFSFVGPLDDYYKYSNRFIESIKDYDNIILKPEYDNFSLIKAHQYDISLLASRSEGMPNIILESIGANLFIIASSVGGVPEVIEDGVNGYLISDPLEVNAYVRAIKRFYKDFNQDMFDKQLKLNQEIINKRTEENLIKCLDKVYNIKD